MAKRITVMIDEDKDRKLRQIQAKTIEKTEASYSYSKCLNDQLEKALK